jgi:hypothetical protein
MHYTKTAKFIVTVIAAATMDIWTMLADEAGEQRPRLRSQKPVGRDQELRG